MSNDLDDFDQWLIDLPDECPEICPERAGMKEFGFNEFLKVEDSIVPQLTTQLDTLKMWYRTPSLDGLKSSGFSEKDFPRIVHAIRSMVGDDEVITSNSLLYSVLAILLGPLVAEIKISWEDVQFSQWLFNYAEGFIFIPMSKDSDFESVNRYNRGNGVPFVLDPIKFKDLSAVRKQSAMDVDLPSKFRNLSQRAAWTNPHWFTWAQHQHALILGVEIFDFMRSKIFPFLFQWEGGCGGAPPFNNMHTAAGMIFRFRGGRAKAGILGIMSDSNQLQRGEISPAHAFFTKNLNLAVSGDKRWLSIRSELERRKQDAIAADIPWDTSIRDEAGRSIPPSLISKSTIVDPEDAYTGVCLSFLREKGYIVTELDLVERQESDRRLKAIWGPIPMQEIEDQIALRKEEYLHSFHEEITNLFEMRPHEHVREHYRNLGTPFSDEALMVMAEYYRLRVTQALRFNSFIYNERVLIFKTQDVEEYYERGCVGIKDGFCESVGLRYRPEQAKRLMLPDERKVHDDIQQWLDSADLASLLKEPIPPGIGPDDMRITRNLIDRLLRKKAEGCDGALCIIISSDVQLIFSAQRLLDHELGQDFKTRVVGLKTNDYIQWSLNMSPGSASRFNRGASYRPPHRRGSKASPSDALLDSIKIYNIVSRQMSEIGVSLRAALGPQLAHFWNCQRVGLAIEYDFPNINRRCLRLQYDRQHDMVTETSGGYLSKEYLDSTWQFPILEFQTISQLPEFRVGAVKSYYKSSSLGTRIRLIVPRSFSTIPVV